MMGDDLEDMAGLGIDSDPSPVRHYGLIRDTHDERDFRYAAPAHVLRTLPASIDLSTKFGAQKIVQGSLGACGPNSAAADILYDEVQAHVTTMPSRLFIYYCTRMLQGNIGQDAGVSNRQMLKALAQYGWCDESMWPYDVGRFTVRPSAACFTAAAKNRITRYERIAQNLDQMRGALASGDPFIFGFTVYASFESSAVARTGIVPMPRSGERIMGGHDVLFVGYDDATRRFKFRNWWENSPGVLWGDRGHGYMPYDYATNPNLSNDFWTIQWAVKNDPTPTPSPQPSPSPSGNKKVTIDWEAGIVSAPAGWRIEANNG